MQDEMKLQAQPIDHSEAQMARADLYRGAKNAMKLFQMVQDGQQLEGWVQAKITKAADYLDSVYHYMEYQVKFGTGDVAVSLDDITSDAVVSIKQGEVSEEDDEQRIKESMNYEQKLKALLEGAKNKEIMKKKLMKSVGEGKTEVQYDKDDARTGVKHKSTIKYSDEPHTEPKSQAKSQSAAAKKGDQDADKAQEKKGKAYEKAYGKGSVTRVKDGKKVSEGAKPDFLDVDGDKNKKEPFSKAVADKKKAGPQKGVNPFAKKGAAPKKGINPFAKKPEVKEYKGAAAEKKESVKESVMESVELKNIKFLAGLK